MDLQRAFLAIVLSFLILVGYQYFFVKSIPQAEQAAQQTAQEASLDGAGTTVPAAAPAQVSNIPTVPVDPKAREISIDTPLYTAIVNEQGGGLQSFVLKNYRNTHDKDSGPMQLVTGENPADLPVLFSLDNGAAAYLPIFHADATNVKVTGATDTTSLAMSATTPEGVRIERSLTFRGDSYLVDVAYTLVNTTDKTVQVSPALSLANKPFEHASQTSRYLFSGPAAYINKELIETKAKKLKDGPLVLQGQVSWDRLCRQLFHDLCRPDHRRCAQCDPAGLRGSCSICYLRGYCFACQW